MDRGGPSRSEEAKDRSANGTLHEETGMQSIRGRFFSIAGAVTSTHWRDQAELARVAAANARDNEFKEALFRIAREYDGMAELAVVRARQSTFSE
jgi:hypothetical protein